MRKLLVSAWKPHFNLLMLLLLFLLWNYCSLVLMLMEHAWLHIHSKNFWVVYAVLLNLRSDSVFLSGMFWRWTGGTSQWTDPQRERCSCRRVRVNMLISLLSDSRPWAKGVVQLQRLMVHNGVFTSIMFPCQWNSEIKIEYTGFLGCPNVTFVGTLGWYMCPV